MKRVQIWNRLGGMALLLVAVSPAAPSTAGEPPPGYWSCNGTQWVAVGSPEHPLPLVQCGGTPTGDGGAVTPELCEKAGGIWGPVGLFPEPVCTQRTFDAGRYCADMGECAASCDASLTEEQYQAMLEGEAVATGGQCSPTTPLIGCHAMVTAGRVDGTLCID